MITDMEYVVEQRASALMTIACEMGRMDPVQLDMLLALPLPGTDWERRLEAANTVYNLRSRYGHESEGWRAMATFQVESDLRESSR